MIRILESSAVVSEGFEAISKDTAWLLAVATNHQYLPSLESKSYDGYFARSELDRAFGRQQVGREQKCALVTHQILANISECEHIKDNLRLLIRSISPLTDDSGKLAACAMLSRILQCAGNLSRLHGLYCSYSSRDLL